MTAYSITAHPTLQARVNVIARRDEDRAQNMYLHLLEQERHNPEFAKQELGYHVKAAKFAAQHDVERRTIYNKYVECEPYMIDEDGSFESVFDTLIPDGELLPEEQVERNELAAELRKAISALPDNQRKIAGMLLKGFAPFEIAAKLGTSRANVSQIMTRMRPALADALSP